MDNRWLYKLLIELSSIEEGNLTDLLILVDIRLCHIDIDRYEEYVDVLIEINQLLSFRRTLWQSKYIENVFDSTSLKTKLLSMERYKLPSFRAARLNAYKDNEPDLYKHYEAIH